MLACYAKKKTDIQVSNGHVNSLLLPLTVLALDHGEVDSDSSDSEALSQGNYVKSNR